MIIKNKRGDIPITILVIGVLAICALVIFSFYSSNQKFKSGFGSIGIVEKAVVEAEKVSFYRDVGFSESEIEKILKIQPADAIGPFIVVEDEGISVKHYLP